MSWRRRLLGTSALLGVAVLCLRPVLTAGIEKRLSEQFRLPVSIGDTQLAMSQSSLMLSKIQIDDDRCPLAIDELMLRLDGNALLYRNCIVESFVGNGLRWFLPTVSDSIPPATIPIVATSGETAIKEIQQTFAQTIGFIKVAENASLDRTREIDHKLEAIQKKIDDAIYHGPVPNPLRVSQTIEKLRSDLLAIQSLIAAERVEAAKIDAVTASSLEQLSSGLESAKSNVPKSSVTVKEISNAIIENALRLVSERVSPYALAAEMGYQRLVNQSIADQSRSIEVAAASLVTAGRELVTERIPPREFTLKRGKLTGESSLGDKSLKTEISISSIRLNRNDSNVLQISWKNPDMQGSETLCRIGPILGADNAISPLLNLTQREATFEATVQIDYSPGFRNVLLTFPMSQILDQIQEIDRELLDTAKRICEEKQIVYSARALVDFDDSTLVQSADWTAQPNAADEVLNAIENAMELYLSRQREAWLSETQTVYSNCKNLIESRKLAMEEERNYRYSNWNDTVKSMESKLNSLGNQSRSALSRDSNLVR